MAKFEITIDEYRRWHHAFQKRTWKNYLVWTIAGVVFAASLFIGQYAFAVLWGALLVFAYVTSARVRPRLEAYQVDSPFAMGPFEVELRPEGYTLRVGASELKLGLTELGHSHDFGDHYRLDHTSGNNLHLPKRALSEDEIRIVESYRQQYPGHPEKTAMQMFAGKRHNLPLNPTGTKGAPAG
jgi:hypothetical protein